MIRPVFKLLFVVVSGVMLMSCSDEHERGPCVPGATQLCFCAGGAQGSQVCNDDGESWGVCECGTSDGDADIDGDADVHPDAGTDGDRDIDTDPDVSLDGESEHDAEDHVDADPDEEADLDADPDVTPDGDSDWDFDWEGDGDIGDEWEFPPEEGVGTGGGGGGSVYLELNDCVRLPLDADSAVVTFGFGGRARDGTFHLGVDFDAEIGEVVHASRSGEVLLSTFREGERNWGGIVAVASPLDDGTEGIFIYGHLERDSLVRLGEEVNIGDPIGVIEDPSSVGHTWGPHLHFQVAIDNPEWLPAGWRSPPGYAHSTRGWSDPLVLLERIASTCDRCSGVCGDGCCEGTENACTCPGDCTDHCGDGCCTGTESECSCPSECTDRCGDGCCTGTETCSGCPADCGCRGGAVCIDGACIMCGNRVCDVGESDCPDSCPEDCSPRCGDGCCTGPENNSTCPEDCDPRCGDTVCSGTETECTCPGDCSARCGDSCCSDGETACSCDADCGGRCGDGCCTDGETACSCDVDCGGRCGDGCCTDGETACTCDADCLPRCGDGCCTGGETACSCDADCGGRCGDGCCTDGETACSCDADCGGRCGDGCCTDGETACSCDADCLPRCGDGCCTGGETCDSCRADCAAMCCGGDGEACCAGACDPGNICVVGTCRREPAASMMYRFRNRCDNAHWQSNGRCYPGSTPTTGCGCADRIINPGCPDSTCWTRETTNFWTYDTEPTFGDFFLIYHCFEGGANLYQRSACGTPGVPATLGWIARSSISIWDDPVYLCRWRNGAGVFEHIFMFTAAECTTAGGTLVDGGVWGYVVR